MGVSFYGYSNVRAEPVPVKYRPKRIAKTEREIRDIKIAILSAPPELQPLVLINTGASITSTGNVIVADKLVYSDAMQKEFHTLYEQQDDFIGVCWETETMYWRTSDTDTASCDFTYSGYAELYKDLRRMNMGRPLAYELADTPTVAPEYGFIPAGSAKLYFRDLQRLRHYYVLDAWDPVYDSEEADETPENNKRELSTLFRLMYAVAAKAADSGLLHIN